MNIKYWLQSATKELRQSDIATARLDCLVLLADCLNTNSTHLLAHPETILTSAQEKCLKQLIARRRHHEPLAYIRGKTEFYGREFIINNHVLEPRPESETMIELLKKLSLASDISIADIGTGSGALGITAALELKIQSVDFYDIDTEALEVAKENAQAHNVLGDFYVCDLLGNKQIRYDVLLCNLPYVPDDFHINTAAMHEPSIAIFGGSDGLEVYRKLFAQITTLTNKPSYVLAEALPPQHAKLAQIAASAGYALDKSEDFIQVFRATDSTT